MVQNNTGLGRLILIENAAEAEDPSLTNAILGNIRKSGRKVDLVHHRSTGPNTVGTLVERMAADPGEFGLKAVSSATLQALRLAGFIDTVEQLVVPKLETGVDVVFEWRPCAYSPEPFTNPNDKGLLDALANVERMFWDKLRPLVLYLIAPNDRSETAPTFALPLADDIDDLIHRLRENLGCPIFVLYSSQPSASNTGLDSSAQKRKAQKTTRRRREVQTSDSNRRLFNEMEPNTPNGATAPIILNHLLPIRPSVVYDTYWRLASMRQEIFFKRFEGQSQPWTDDPILKAFKFTNAYRASDRVSQYLIRRVIYRDDLPMSGAEVVFRTLLFKLFNKIETWELLEHSLGPIIFDAYRFETYNKVLNDALAGGTSIYSAAYIMPSGGRELGHPRKHQSHLALLERMMKDRFPARLTECESMQQAFELLRGYPSIGDFLAYQYVTDLNYSEVVNFSETEFVVPGPGARDGMRKCFVDNGGLNDPELIRFVADRQEEEFERLGISFRTLWGRRLQLIDCQNLFCEVDKYARVRHPEVTGISGRTRIKQRYTFHSEPISYWYPPKWKLNHLIRRSETDSSGLKSCESI